MPHDSLIARFARGVLLAAIGFGLGTQALAALPKAPKDWFHVVRLDASTYLLAQPKYWRQSDPDVTNVSYLLIGQRRALLIDTGPGIYGLKNLVGTLTTLPILVVPSHLHFDHTAGMVEFSDVGLLDIPELRAQVRDGVFYETETQYILKGPPLSFRVSHWIKDEATIDLGNRVVTLISTPGHTPDSITIIDRSGKRAFSGDVMERDILALTEGSDASRISASIRRISQMLPYDGLDYEAHREAPWRQADLSAVANGIDSLVRGEIAGQPACVASQPMNTYRFGMFTLTRPPAGGENLKALDSKEAPLEGTHCTSQ